MVLFFKLRSILYLLLLFHFSNLVEEKHEESTEATSDGVHHQVAEHIDGGGDAGQGEGHLW